MDGGDVTTSSTTTRHSPRDPKGSMLMIMWQNGQERGNDRKNRPNETRGVKDISIGLILVHAFEINEMLTKDSNSTTDAEDRDEDARPGSGGVVEREGGRKGGEKKVR